MNLEFIDRPSGGPPPRLTSIMCVVGRREALGRRTNPLIYLDDLGRDHCTPELPSPMICKWPAAPHPACKSSAFAPTYTVHSEWVTRDGKAQGCAGAGAWAGCRPPKEASRTFDRGERSRPAGMDVTTSGLPRGFGAVLGRPPPPSPPLPAATACLPELLRTQGQKTSSSPLARPAAGPALTCEADTGSQCQERPRPARSQGRREGGDAQPAAQRRHHHARPRRSDPSPRCSRQPGGPHYQQQTACATPRRHLGPGTLRLRTQLQEAARGRCAHAPPAEGRGRAARTLELRMRGPLRWADPTR